METSELQAKFTAQFDRPATNFFFAPGRINLIGEHTDYNGGHVFPAAISLGTYAAVAPNDDQTWRLYSENFAAEGIYQLDMAQLNYQKVDGWTNYFKGMLQVEQAHGATFSHGLDILIWGDLPNGAGLSSSASLELLSGKILEKMFGTAFSTLDQVKFGKEVENNYIGLNSGIMDQFAIGLGQKDQALFLDTNTLEYEPIPVKLGDHVIVIMNTNKRRELSDSKYNERRSECERALAEIQEGIAVDSLGALTNEQFDEYTSLISDPVLIKRARHAVFENQRTIKATTALKANDLARFGRLINASGVSLEYDYEVTGIELDTLVHAARAQAGVLGARMTGAGFGGSAIAIVAKEDVPAFIEHVGAIYQEKIGYAADFYVAQIADGPKEITVE